MSVRSDLIMSGIVILGMGIGGYYWMVEELSKCDSFSTDKSMLDFVEPVCSKMVLIRLALLGIGALGFCIVIYGAVAKKQIAKVETS